MHKKEYCIKGRTQEGSLYSYVGTQSVKYVVKHISCVKQYLYNCEACDPSVLELNDFKCTFNGIFKSQHVEMSPIPPWRREPQQEVRSQLQGLFSSSYPGTRKGRP